MVFPMSCPISDLLFYYLNLLNLEIYVLYICNCFMSSIIEVIYVLCVNNPHSLWFFIMISEQVRAEILNLCGVIN